MANDQEELEALADDLSEEATERYNSFIEVVLLIALSRRTKADKIKEINKQLSKLIDWNSKFTERNLAAIYRKQSREAYKEVSEKIEDISTAQEAELAALVAGLQEEMNGAAENYAKKARKLAINEEIKRIREERLGFTDGGMKQVTSAQSRKLREDMEFRDSKGRIITAETVLGLTVGDAVWVTIQNARASTWIKAGYPFGVHRSVIDDRTTAICRYLDGRVRDLRKDQLPPLHRHCRSRIEVVVSLT